MTIWPLLSRTGRTFALAGLVAVAGCDVRGNTEPGETAPPPIVIDQEGDDQIVHVEHQERFPLVTAVGHEVAPALTVTGVVNPDVSRAIPVVSLASGRVIEVRARLGDDVHQGQLLLRIQSADVSAAIADAKKARADEVLAKSQLERASELYGRGAIARKDLELAQSTAAKAAVDVDNATNRLRVLGVDATSPPPTGMVDIVAPLSGVITEQNVANAGGVKTLDNSPNLFTISDLSHVWIVCDVYEHDVPTVRVGDPAEIHVAALPGQVLRGRIGNIGPILDPTLRTAKVRVEVVNPGWLRIGMFVTATFHSQTTEMRAVVPASAILHLHDREWVYVTVESGGFERREVVSGQTLPDNQQELVSGVRPGERVVSNALVLHTVGQ